MSQKQNTMYHRMIKRDVDKLTGDFLLAIKSLPLHKRLLMAFRIITKRTRRLLP